MSSRPISELTEGQVALRRFMALGAALVLLLLVGVATLLASGSWALDDLQAREDRARVTMALERSLRGLVRDVTTATVWNQAYEEFRPGGDPKWADEEVGSYFANNRGHDLTVAIDSDGRPFYAWAGDARAAPSSQDRFLADAAPLIRRVRALEADRGGRPLPSRPADPGLAETTSGVVVSDGVHYLTAVSTVTPESADIPRRRTPAVVVVSAQRMDGPLMTTLRQIRIPEPRLDEAPRHPRSALALRDAGGRPVGWISWEPKRPGLRVLKDAAPVVALGLLAVGGVMAALGLQILRVARRLGAHERDLTAAMRELEAARDRAEAANIAKSQFLANMSHEIRTPLNGVLGMAQVLGRSDLAPADREKVDVIRSSGEALLCLLNDILDLSKIEAGRMELDPQPFDLEAAVAAATRGFAALASQKGIRFFAEVEPAAQGVWMGDAGRFRQVLANLVSNAVKFTAAGEVRVGVRRTPGGLACTVSDTGVGIAPDLVARLFQRFSQVDPTATRRYGGSGLGLAITRQFVELMGGKVSLTSVEGRGSAFTFDLPLEWLHAAAAPAAEAVPAAEPVLTPSRILAAEDNATNRLLLGAMLAPLGAELVFAEDGRQAVDALAEGRFDLVLMDVQMPVMNGVDAASAIRALEAERGLRRTPILAVSANVMPGQIQDYLAAGMDGVVAKPIEMAALVTAIEAALRSEGRASASAAA
ncbi:MULTISPECIES: ATP-binding protein [unclassified Phenylobacterium]|uniref:hybrid sensor histidine kinase/response regulator n=1 Tax=unclassified Phenylobacterium TaxID=2640670 RepID=UPI00083A5D11|nr:MULTISPECIES: ATP-binding protein [unclassified Phenylobacterium]